MGSQSNLLEGYVTPQQLAQQLGVTTRTISHWEVQRLGPPRFVIPAGRYSTAPPQYSRGKFSIWRLDRRPLLYHRSLKRIRLHNRFSTSSSYEEAELRSTLICARCFLSLVLLLLVFSCCSAAGQQASSATDAKPAYLNPDLPVDQRVDDLVSRMTLEEKASQVVHQAAAIPRLNVPAYNWWTESLHGVASGIATVFPEPVGLAATFDPPLSHDMATVISTEALPKQSGEYLLEVIMRRYENRSTIMTSNRPLEDWGKLLSDVPTAGAILDRFLHHAITLTITGRSYRVKDAPLASAETKKKRPTEAPPSGLPAGQKKSEEENE